MRKLICGMEIHAELKTTSKLFCSCKNDPFHAPQPNIYTCPVCLGMPGGLPVINKKAVEWTIKLGLALHCKINLFSKFDRKHYFYPDLPKGYQISQYDLPFCYDGVLETEAGPVRIRRIHLEEDTAKLQHKVVDGEKVSLIDFNRSSVPLVEIVTDPDIHTPEHAKACAKELRRMLRFLDIADCDMDQGGMRLEANVSMQDGVEVDLNHLPQYKVELKNINSFRFLEKAIQYEMKRQTEELDSGQIPIQETRGWNDAKGQTYSQRIKEDAEDYRYFPDPDLPPLQFTETHINTWRSELPELPKAVQTRWQEEFGVENRFSDLFVEERAVANWAEELFTVAKASKVDTNKLANAVVNRKVQWSTEMKPANVIADYQELTQVSAVDPKILTQVISQILAENPLVVEQYRTGKTQVIGFFIGQVSKNIGQKIDPQIVSALLMKQLS